MTREEAKVILKGFMENPLYSDIPKVCRAFDMAIKALEQEPSEDTEVIKVSKGTVKARQGRYVIYDVEWLKKHFYATEEKIYGQPKQPCDDAISREDAKSFLYERLNRLNNDELYDIFSVIIDDMYNELPSVQLKSRWIPVTTRPLTEEEKQEIEEQGERYCRFMYDCELPDDGQEVLITTSGGYVIGTTFHNEGIDGCYFECYEDEGDVKAWMPLPEPYEPSN